MILLDKKVAIDPIDPKSQIEFEKRGFSVISSNDFDINKL